MGASREPKGGTYEFRVDDFLEAVSRRGKILRPVARPAHRSIEVTGEHRNNDLLVVQGCFAAEAAAHIRCDDADAMSRTSRRSTRRSRMTPGICVDRVRVSERRPRSYSARQARFSMATGVLRWNRKTAADPYRSCPHFRFDIAARKLAHRQHVCSRMLVQHRRILPDGRLGIDHGFEGSVGDLDPIAPVLREASVLGQNRQDGLTDITNLPRASG